MQGPTKKQQTVLRAIEEYCNLHHRSPSYRELMESLGYRSPASIWRFVEALKRKGLIKSEKKQWRSIELPQLRSTSRASIPVIGTVSRGRTPELYPKAEECPLAREMLSDTGHFYALRIKDSSFLNEFLLPGDLIVVEATQEVDPGELVLASTDETFIGHFFDEGEIIRFRSNPYSLSQANQPNQIKLIAEEVQVWGVIILVIRRSTHRL